MEALLLLGLLLTAALFLDYRKRRAVILHQLAKIRGAD